MCNLLCENIKLCLVVSVSAWVTNILSLAKFRNVRDSRKLFVIRCRNRGKVFLVIGGVGAAVKFLSTVRRNYILGW